MSKILANQIANYGDDAPIEIKEGLNIPAGKPIQAAGNAGSSGQVLSTTGVALAWITPFDGDYNSLSNRPTIPAAQVNSDWDASSGPAVILNKPSVPPFTTLVVNPAGTAALSFNGANGQFTYTPPDLSGYATETWVGSQGYLTSYAESDTLDTVTTRGGTTLNNISVGNFSSSGISSVTNSLTLGNGSSTFTILFSQSTGASPRIVNTITESGLAIQGAYNFGSTYAEDILLGTSGDSSRFKNLNPQADLSYNLGSSTAKWDNIYAGKLYYSNNFATTGDLPSAEDYHGMFAHVHAEGHGYFAHGGSWVQLLDEGSSIDELSDVNTTTNADGYVLKWEASSSSWKPAPDLVGTSTAGITLQDLSVQTASAGTPSLSYSNTTGVFTYTPPDLSSYLTSETDPVFGASAAAGILSSNISNWDAAHGWGNHASAGYLTSLGDAAGVTTAKISNWDTAYGWGDHGAAGYLTSVALNGVSDVTITSPQTNDVLTYNGSGWVNSAPTGGQGGGGGANVTISDTIPAGSPSAGDLWWESDTGRLKVYYQDTDSSQWVDASPPLADATTIGGSGTVSMMAHILPNSNAAHDIGSAEFKIRHLFLSDNTLYHEGPYLKVAQHDAGESSAGAASFLITLAKLKEALNASADYDAFKAAILAITDA